MRCPECEAKGYQEEVTQNEYDLKSVKVWCEKCKGMGNFKYQGDRSDISWERE